MSVDVSKLLSFSVPWYVPLSSPPMAPDTVEERALMYLVLIKLLSDLCSPGLFYNATISAIFSLSRLCHS